MIAIIKRAVRPAAYGLIAALSRDRLAGEQLPDALGTASMLRRGGYEIALAYWNRADESPHDIIERYEEIVRAIPSVGGTAYLSMKAPAFAGDSGNAFPYLLALAQSLDVQLHFDSADIEAADEILRLMADNADAASTIGCTLPGRWRRSLSDAEGLSDRDVAIRVVKGEWPDPSAPSLDPQRGFIEVVKRLAGRKAPVRIATHNPKLAEWSVELLRAAGTPCDVELLYGFPARGLTPRLKALGVPVRVYVPFGYGWVPYCLNYVRNRPSFLCWLLRDSFAGAYPASYPALRSVD